MGNFELLAINVGENMNNHSVSDKHSTVRMLGTFNQHLPMILSDEYYSHRKPTSLLDTGMGGVLAL